MKRLLLAGAIVVAFPLAGAAALTAASVAPAAHDGPQLPAIVTTTSSTAPTPAPTPTRVAVPAPAPAAKTTMPPPTVPEITPTSVAPPSTTTTTEISEAPDVPWCDVGWTSTTPITNPNEENDPSGPNPHGFQSMACSDVQNWEAQQPSNYTFTVVPDPGPHA